MRYRGFMMIIVALAIIAGLIVFLTQRPGLHHNVLTLPAPGHNNSAQSQ
ncbi:MAG TPA: hypothetical protein VFJ18_08595 [Pararhizobium sp.]|nr:hypothetical protein [Pararhizobium sp.]